MSSRRDDQYYDAVDNLRVGNPPIGPYVPVSYSFKPIPLGQRVALDAFFAEVTTPATDKMEIWLYAGGVFLGKSNGLVTSYTLTFPIARTLYGGESIRMYFPTINTPGTAIGVNANYSGLRNPY